MKPPEDQPKPSRAAGVGLVVSLVAVVALAGLVAWLKMRADALRAKLDTGIARYEREMKDLKRKILELQQRIPVGGAEKEPDPSEVPAILEEKAKKAGLPQVPIVPSTARAGGWKETAFRLDLRRPSRDALVARGPLVDFLQAVERGHPYLKSKSLNFTFAGGPDLDRASVTISYFKRE